MIVVFDEHIMQAMRRFTNRKGRKRLSREISTGRGLIGVSRDTTSVFLLGESKFYPSGVVRFSLNGALAKMGATLGQAGIVGLGWAHGKRLRLRKHINWGCSPSAIQFETTTIEHKGAYAKRQGFG